MALNGHHVRDARWLGAKDYISNQLEAGDPYGIRCSSLRFWDSLSMTHVLLRLDNIGYQLGQQVILSDIDLSLKQEEILTIVGPNGAGKSTLLKIILGLLKPTSGKVFVDPRVRFGYVPQKLKLDPTFPMTVKRYLQMAKAPKALYKGVDYWLRELDIAYLAQFALHTLSGGELQRVLLARALLRAPNILVLDEPTQGLDLVGQQAFYQQLTHLREQTHCSILLVSHDLHVVMAASDQVICIHHHLCCSGHPDDVSRHPEFIQLLGEVQQPAVAVYQHHHDHHHDLSGHVERDAAR